MAAYLTPADLRLVLAGSENTPGTAANLSDADLTDAIDEAQAEVDGKLTGRYAALIPFTQPPKLVINMTRDIAAYLATLTARRGDPLQPGDPVLLRYTRAEQLLASVAAGTTNLPTPDGTVGSDEAAVSTVAVANQIDGDLFPLADFDIRPARGWYDPTGRYC